MKAIRPGTRQRIAENLKRLDELTAMHQAAGLPREEASRKAYTEMTQPKREAISRRLAGAA